MEKFYSTLIMKIVESVIGLMGVYEELEKVQKNDNTKNLLVQVILLKLVFIAIIALAMMRLSKEQITKFSL